MKNPTPYILKLMRKALKKKTPTTVVIRCDDFTTASAILTEVRLWDGVIDGETLTPKK